MSNTQISSGTTISPEKVTTDEINVANNCYENYRYGELVKTETNYISKKVITDDMEQEKLEAVYTLTFIDHKTKEKESFESSFLPKLHENYFYYNDNGFISKVYNNKEYFINEISNIKETSSERQESLRFVTTISLTSLILSNLVFISNSSGFLTLVFTSILYIMLLFMIPASFMSFKKYRKLLNKRKNEINYIKKNINDILKD